MMKYIRQQPVSLFLIALIWVVCMIPVPETPLSHVSFIDKWTHFGMYGLLTVVIQAEYGRGHSVIAWRRLVALGVAAPIAMGGLVELAQAYLTCGVRSGDWLDFAANATGVVLGCAIGIPLARALATRHRGV